MLGVQLLNAKCPTVADACEHVKALSNFLKSVVRFIQ